MSAGLGDLKPHLGAATSACRVPRARSSQQLGAAGGRRWGSFSPWPSCSPRARNSARARQTARTVSTMHSVPCIFHLLSDRYRSLLFSARLLWLLSAHDQGTVILVVPLVKSERSTQVRSRVGKKNSIETRSSVAASVLRALMDQWQNAPPTWGQSDDPCGESPWEGVTCGGDKVISM